MTTHPPRLRNFKPRMKLSDIPSLKGRSRMIERLKYSLPGIALVALVVLIGWPQFQKWTYGQKPTLAQTRLVPKTNNTATLPEYKSIDNKNQPYTITADHGVETSPEEIDLTQPKMDLNLHSGERVTLTSDSGKLNKATNQIHLVGNVTLTHSLGYHLHTAQAWIDYNQGTAHSNDAVWGNGPAGTIEARGFRMTERGAKVSFIGGAQLLLMKGEKPE
ncbi:MAG: LPS export ABC transporter periplasmic protein LptC [Alphaproteobacteria bacterium]|nr:LPS export ABC transporter periplasmic protein LptC [Alphaproteobacteria bacterium]